MVLSAMSSATVMTGVSAALTPQAVCWSVSVSDAWLLIHFTEFTEDVCRITASFPPFVSAFLSACRDFVGPCRIFGFCGIYR